MLKLRIIHIYLIFDREKYMRITTEIIKDRVGFIPIFDVRFELFKDTERIRLLSLSIISCQPENEIMRFSQEVYDYGEFVFIKTYWSGKQVADLIDHLQKGLSFGIEGYTPIVWYAKAQEIELFIGFIVENGYPYRSENTLSISILQI